jgi:hypothetical protein
VDGLRGQRRARLSGTSPHAGYVCDNKRWALVLAMRLISSSLACVFIKYDLCAMVLWFQGNLKKIRRLSASQGSDAGTVLI